MNMLKISLYIIVLCNSLCSFAAEFKSLETAINYCDTGSFLRSIKQISKDDLLTKKLPKSGLTTLELLQQQSACSMTSAFVNKVYDAQSTLQALEAALTAHNPQQALHLVENTPTMVLNEDLCIAKTPAIFLALAHNNDAVVRTLVAKGVKLTGKSSCGNPLLHHAALYNNSPEIFACLLAACPALAHSDSSGGNGLTVLEQLKMLYRNNASRGSNFTIDPQARPRQLNHIALLAVLKTYGLLPADSFENYPQEAAIKEDLAEYAAEQRQVELKEEHFEV